MTLLQIDESSIKEKVQNLGIHFEVGKWEDYCLQFDRDTIERNTVRLILSVAKDKSDIYNKCSEFINFVKENAIPFGNVYSQINDVKY